MPQIVLDVPFVTQLGFGDPANLRSDPTGCWYASACMIGYFFSAGPRLGNPALFQADLGHLADGSAVGGHDVVVPGSAEEATFMRNENLAKVDLPSSQVWTAIDLTLLLRKYGPVMFYWAKTANGATYGHASVLIGMMGSDVIFHDPENAPRSISSLDDFNDNLLWDQPTVMLRRAGAAYQGTPNPALPLGTPIKPKPTMGSNLKKTGLLGRLLGRKG